MSSSRVPLVSPARWLVVVAIGLMVLGAALFLHAGAWPVYLDAEAPERLSRELEHIEPDRARFDAWYSQLHLYETPHKRLSDLGRGLAAAGLGLLMAGWLWRFFRRAGTKWKVAMIFLAWIALWLIRIPLTFYYYQLRQERFDYPVWGDSMGIPIFAEMNCWIFGAIFSSVLLGLLLIGNSLRPGVQFQRPSSTWGWARAGVIGLWLLFLLLVLGTAIPDGDEGAVLSTMGASVILLAMLGAVPVHRV